MNEPSKLKNSASPKKPPAKKRKSPWKPKKGIFYCDMCPGVTFSTLEILKAHMKRHSLNTLRKPCLLCPIRPRNMEKHMRIAHIEAKPYKCDFCDETFRHNYGRVSTARMRLLSCQQFISNFMFCSQILLSHLGSSYASAYGRTTIPLCYMRKIIQNSRCAAKTQYASAWRTKATSMQRMRSSIYHSMAITRAYLFIPFQRTSLFVWNMWPELFDIEIFTQASTIAWRKNPRV